MRDSARVSSCTGTPPNRLYSEHFSLWIAAPLGAQDTLVRSDPEHYFVPPYVGYRGWVGATLDNDPDWDALGRIIADAYALVAAPKSRAKR